MEEFEKKVGVNFNDKNLLNQAFTHRSYINENRELQTEHNERLEFLGDAVLELVTTEYLYSKYPDKPEGDLTAYRSALVNTQTLSKTAKLLGFNEHLLLSKGESKDTGRARQYILADTFEAVIGAIYLDQGYGAAKKFIAENIFGLLDEIIEKGLWIDAKSMFQEKSQERVSVTPQYKTEAEEGPDHNKQFTVAVYLGKENVAKGSGKSKQEAEQDAARKALMEKGWI
jgi:ribonuclease-3